MPASPPFTPGKVHMIRVASLPTGFVDELRCEFERNGSVQQTARNPMLQEALASSSPALLATLLDDSVEQRLEVTLAIAKYGFRISQRPTPFGGFAAVGTMGVGKTGSLMIEDPQNATRVARLSGPVLQFMAHCASRAAAEILRDSPEETLQSNASLWRSRSGYKFVELQPQREGAGYISAMIPETESIEFLLDSLGASPARACDLVSALEKRFDCRSDDAWDLVSGLVVAGAVVMTDRQCSPFETSSSTSCLQSRHLRDWIEVLGAASRNPQGNVELYRHVQSAIKAVAPEIAAHDHLNVTHVLSTSEATLASDLVERIGRDVRDILPLLVDRGDDRLASFARSLEFRYGSRPIQLIEALDSEQGLGFGHLPPRLDSVVPPMPSSAIDGGAKLDRRTSLLLSIVSEAGRAGSRSVEITDEHLALVEPIAELEELGLLGSLLDAGRKYPSFELRSLSPACGTAFLGRFEDCVQPLSDQLRQFRCDMGATRASAQVVDVIHLPPGRSADVVSGPSQGCPYIDLMGGMDHSDPNCIPISRVFILAQSGELVLLDDEGRPLIPRIGHAFYGDTDGNIPAFRFLSAMQSSEKGRRRGIWDDLQSTCRWFPRLFYKSVLIARERWLLSAKESSAIRQQLLSGGREFIAPGFPGRMLDRVRLVRGDNFHLLDLRHSLDRQILLRELGRPGMHVLECHDDDPAFALTPEGKRHSHEVAITLLGSNNVVAALRPARFDMTWKAQLHPPGGEWLYYKLFSDEESLEKTTIDLFQILKQKPASQAIRSLFFLRYGQGAERHFRLRVRCEDPDSARLVESAVVEQLRAAVKQGTVDHFDASTYQPEILRYGGPRGIAVSEHIFSIDSAAAIKILPLSDRVPRWKVALLSIWRMARIMIKEHEMARILASITTSYAAEFDLAGERLRAVDRQYREMRGTIAAIMSGQAEDLRCFEGIFEERDAEVAVAVEGLEGLPVMSDQYFFSSHLHMCANRLLGADSRMQEAILFNYIHRNLRSLRARNKIAIAG